MTMRYNRFAKIALHALSFAVFAVVSAFSASTAKAEDNGAVAAVGDTQYTTLPEAFAALSAENHTLTLLSDAAWTATTPVYWSAGTQSGYAATFADALTAAYKADADAITIVCRPNADVGKMTHGHVADDLTVYGNNAYISAGECDLEIDTYNYSRTTGAKLDDGACLEKDITITAYELDNLGVWGERKTTYTATINLTDCDGKAIEGQTNVQRVYLTGKTGVNNITLTDCDFLTKATSVFSNADGAIVVKNCTFTGVALGVNINHTMGGAQTVSVEGCTFTNCGDAGDWKQFAAPIRFVNSGSGTMSATVAKTTITGTVGANGDILLGDGRTGWNSNEVSLKVTETAASVQVQKPGYYGTDGTTDTTKVATVTVTASGTFETSDSTYVAKVDGTGYDTLEAALAEVAEGKPLTFVTETAWPVAKPVYYDGKFYAKAEDSSKGALELAIDAANAANSSEVAKIYVRPGFTADELVWQAHQNLKTSLAIYGNDAQLSRVWGPCIEYTTGNAAFHQLTKDVSISIYNLHKGAGVWGARVTDYTVDITLADCKDAYEIMINGSLAPTSVNNYTIKRCTFDGESMANTGGTVVSTSAGKIVIEDCTFANLTQSYVINPNNKNGGAMEVVVKNTSFTNCGKSGVAVIRVAGEKAGTSATVTLDSLTFDEYSAQYAIGIGKKELSENNADITYTITNTAGTLSVFEKGGTATTITPTATTLVASESYAGANFVDLRTFGYDLDGDGTLDALPTAPDMSGTVVNVTAENAQYVLDGAYGSIDGKTINFTESITETLILGRAAKYDGSGTVYRHGSFEGDAMSYANFIAYKSQSGWTEYSYYERTVENVTFTADNGVTIAGFNAEGGNHVYGTTEKPLYDHVRDTSSKDTNNGYYKRTTLKNFTFDRLTFTAKTDISTSNNATVYDGFTFTGCKFNINNGTTDSTDYQAIRYYDEGNSGNLKNLVVEGCKFNGCYQGVYAVHVNGITVRRCTFKTMYHNAIAVQTTTHGACDFGSVVINGNVFSDLKDRAIRFGAVAAGTQITIKNNFVESTSSTEECIKVSGGEDLPEGVTFVAEYNDWGTYLPPAPAQLTNTLMVAKIDSKEYATLFDAFSAAKSGDTVKLIADYTDENVGPIVYDMPGVTFDLNGHTYSHYNFAHIFEGTGGVIKNGKMICLNGGSYALFIGDEKDTTSFTVENVVMEGGINIYNATGVVLKELTIKAQKYYAVWLEKNSAATVESGTYESAEKSEGRSLFNASGNTACVLTLEGGTFKTIGNSLMGGSGGTLVVTGGKFDQNVATPYLDSTKELETYEGSDGFYAVKTKDSEVLTVNAEATEAGTTETKTVQVALTEDVIKTALEKAGVTDADKADSAAKVEALNKEDTNGNPVWVNIVAGIESDKSVAVDAAQNTDAATIDVTPVNIGAVASGMGVQIAYEVDEVTVSTTSDGKQTATVAKQGDAVSAAAIDVDSVETSAYFQVKVLVRQNGSTIATVPATNYIGVLKKTTKMTKTIVPVPWHSLADGGDISVSNVVKTANLTEGDKLSVYDVENKKYNVYTLKDDKTWKPAAVYVIDENGQVSENASEKPTTMLVPRGSGVWLERQNTDTPIVTYGLASATKQTTTLVAAKSEEGDEGTTTPTWSLVAVPTTEAVSLATVAAPENSAKDAVIVPTEGAPKVYTVKDGVWGYDEATEVKDANGNATGIIKIKRNADATLPAGTGFWYVNGGDAKSVNW